MASSLSLSLSFFLSLFLSLSLSLFSSPIPFPSQFSLHQLELGLRYATGVRGALFSDDKAKMWLQRAARHTTHSGSYLARYCLSLYKTGQDQLIEMAGLVREGFLPASFHLGCCRLAAPQTSHAYFSQAADRGASESLVSLVGGDDLSLSLLNLLIYYAFPKGHARNLPPGRDRL